MTKLPNFHAENSTGYTFGAKISTFNILWCQLKMLTSIVHSISSKTSKKYFVNTSFQISKYELKVVCRLHKINIKHQIYLYFNLKEILSVFSNNDLTFLIFD